MGVDQGRSRVRMPGLPRPKPIAHHNAPPSPVPTLASKSASRFKRSNVTVPRSRRSMATRVGCSKARRSIPPNMVTWPTRIDGSTGPSSWGGGDSRVCASIIRSRDTAVVRGSLSPASSSVFQCRAWSLAVSRSKRSALKTRLPAMARSEPTAAAASNRKISMSNLLPTSCVAAADSSTAARSWASRSASSGFLLLSLLLLSSARDAPQPQSGPSPSPPSRPRP